MDFLNLFRTLPSSGSLLDRNRREIHLDPLQKAFENKQVGDHFFALQYAEQAQQQSEIDALYLLGKQYQEEANLTEAQIFFQRAASGYAHPKAALELIKTLYQDTITDHAEIERLALVVVPKAGEEITPQDRENMLALGELYLENIHQRLDKTASAKQLLSKILCKETTVENIPSVYPKMKELAAQYETPEAENAKLLFDQARTQKIRGNHESALHYAELAQKNGEEDALFLLGKMYDTPAYAKQCFSIAAHQYLHRQAALALIKILYEEIVTDHEEVTALSLIILPEPGKEITQQDNSNMLTLGELYLENSRFWSDKTDSAKKLLTKITLIDIPKIFPHMRNLKASLNTLPQQFAMKSFT